MLAAILSALAPDPQSVGPGASQGGRDSSGKSVSREGGVIGSGDYANTTIFLGHDTDVNGIGTILDIGWKASPYPDNTTAPNAGLRFESVCENLHRL